MSRGSKSSQMKWLKVLYWGLVICGIYFAYLNITPYQRAVEFLSNKTVNDAFLKVVAIIPIVNGLASILGKGITWILGAVLWGVIQIIEVLPIILYNHQKFMSILIDNVRNSDNIPIDEDDDPALRMIKGIYNRLPTSVISNMEKLKVFTYVVDFCICISMYSPVASGKFTDFFFILVTGQWNKLDYANLMLALITLFAIEIIVSLIIWVGKLIYMVKKAAEA